MPVVSRFYGIAIYIYPGDHPPPHFHARYAGTDAQFSILEGALLAGRPPRRVESLVREWAKLRREELLANWDRAVAQAPLIPIPPLE